MPARISATFLTSKTVTKLQQSRPLAVHMAIMTQETVPR